MKAMTVVLLIASVFAGLCLAHDPGMHMYMGSKTFDVWRDFDPDFYALLTRGEDDYLGVYTRKFYYIGLTIPDLLIPPVESIVSGLLGGLHEYGTKDTILYYLIEAYGQAVGPLLIYDVTDSLVRDPIYYGEGEYPLNSSLAKATRMAFYARDSSNWATADKAIIYGCYMHMVQDFLGGTVLQPSRFGHGFALDSDSALSKPILSYSEMQYEILAGTFVDSTQWRFMDRDLFRSKILNTQGFTQFGGYMDFCQSYPTSGQMIPYLGWQDGDYAPVGAFTSAMNRYFDVHNLTQERLEAYLHGWGILNFMLYGYAGRSNPPSMEGGPMAHPDWTPSQICDFWDGMGDQYFRVDACPTFVLDILLFLTFRNFYPIARGFLFPTAVWLFAPDIKNLSVNNSCIVEARWLS